MYYTSSDFNKAYNQIINFEFWLTNTYCEDLSAGQRVSVVSDEYVDSTTLAVTEQSCVQNMIVDLLEVF